MAVAENIYKLREANHLSQEEFANLFHVTHQAVQKWETGITQPSFANVIAIAKYFQISIDSLMLDSSERIVERMCNAKEILPNFHETDGRDYDLMLEYRQTMEEGYDIEKYQELFQAVSKMDKSLEKEQISNVLFRIVCQAERKSDYPYVEPSDLSEIKALRKAYEFRQTPVSEDVLRKKIEGAWVGRICGCLLGKPVEGIRLKELIPLLKETNNYPMHRYILSTDLTEEMYGKYKFGLRGKCWADTVSCAPVDDDTNYTVMAQLLINKHGRDFTPEQVGRLWIRSQELYAYWTAERVAYRNMINGYLPPSSAQYKNPYREWIGAQIRGDYFGYINPGNPELAAEMAWRDASISHVKNGIYGEMFVAAMLACAAVTDNMEDVIRGGLAQIPPKSRLYEEVMELLQNFKSGMSSKDCFAGIFTKYDDCDRHHSLHTISNALIVVAALLYGNGDYGKSVCLAVEAGFDTDCNGATVGSIVGMMKGIDAIGEEWKKPIQGKVATSIFGLDMVEVSDFVENAMKHTEL